MQKLEAALLASKFRGTLLGVLVGDCCGIPFEFDENIQPIVIRQNLDKLEGEYFKAPFRQYSDDTAMTRALATALLGNYSQKEVAKGFTREFFAEPFRGYGASIPTLFEKLRASKFEDPTKPARKQFNGTGSFGNGGAMRVAPVALYCWNNLEELTRVTKEVTEVTHANKLGINGALLQAYAIQQALNADPSKDLEVEAFSDELLTKMERAEAESVDDIEPNKKEYQIQIHEMKKLLQKDPTSEEVVNCLGHSVSALFSVPTAIYCFLRSQKKEHQEAGKHPFRTTLEYSIGLGGDTDTIASMACAIAGAFYGDSVISTNLLRHLEAVNSMIELADRLYEKRVSV